MTYGFTSKSSTLCLSDILLAVRLLFDGAAGGVGAGVAVGAIERG